MELKTYQEATLHILREYLQEARIHGAEQAYHLLTESAEMRSCLGGLRGYKTLSGLDDVPRVCFKIPTGGGKTILAAYSLRILADAWCDKENPVVIWFTPSDTIRRQTAEALKNPRHPYRKVLDEAFGGRVRVFDLDEKFQIRPSDIEQNMCIIVSTMQSFRQSSTDKYNVYKHNENLEPHFSTITRQEGMDVTDKGTLKFSFANLLYHHRPIVIVDEAHKAVTDLSKEMHQRLNPCAILEFTATPYTQNNTLYSVNALELKDEEMIKMPIVLEACRDWEQAIQDAILWQKYLEEQCKTEKEYIRPIVLIQAQSHLKGDTARVVPEVVKEHLMTVHKIREEQIAIVTGEQKELDQIDIFSKGCPIRFIITIEALKEGWDCSFAYILCSLTNIKSSTAIQQLLGRVLRMPYAKKRQKASLNKSYAFVCSPNFTDAAGDIIECLENCGFDNHIAAACVEAGTQTEQGYLSGFGYEVTDIVLTAEESEQVQETQNIKLEDDGNGNKRVCVTIFTTPEELNAFSESLPVKQREKAQVIHERLKHHRNKYLPDRVVSAAEKGETFVVPRLMAEIQGQLMIADTDDIIEAFAWDINDFASWRVDAKDIYPDSQGTKVEIDINGNPFRKGTLEYKYTNYEQMDLELGDVVPDGWNTSELVIWLDQKLRQRDINQAEMIRWLSCVVNDLVAAQGISLTKLMQAKYSLANHLQKLIAEAREKMRRKAYQLCLFGQNSRVELNFENGFEFKAGMYEDAIAYQGAYQFTKHFLPKIPDFDGAEEGEELECAKQLDSLAEVKYWIRNKARDRSSFYLPTSTDRFYPDFIALLNDGRILVVEYKGEDRLTNNDTAEKRNIGALWEKHSNGKGLFMIASGSKKAGFLENLREKIRLIV